MKDMKEIRNKISILHNEKLFLKSLNKEKDEIIEKLMYKVEQLENDLEYSKVNGSIKKLVKTNRPMIRYN